MITINGPVNPAQLQAAQAMSQSLMSLTSQQLQAAQQETDTLLQGILSGATPVTTGINGSGGASSTTPVTTTTTSPVTTTSPPVTTTQPVQTTESTNKPTWISNGTFFLPAGGTINLGAYSAAPTWVWVGR